MGIFWIFIFSLPIFYVIGIVSFIKALFGKSQNEKFLDILKRELQTNPNISLKEFTSKLESTPITTPKNELSDNNLLFEENQNETEIVKEKTILTRDVSDVWENWYSNNSINLLLYIGAFLIVAAASIFVGFQWSTLSGVIKALMLSSLSLLFIFCGFWFHSIPKIRSAGSTFIGIGALLIPVCSTGWYNFVLNDAGVNPGTVWFVSSIISLSFYSYLTIKLKEVFYSYASSLAVLSISLSFVNVAGLSRQTYILAALISSFILLITGLISKRGDGQNYKYFGMPMELSSQFIIPITLFYGFMVTASENLLFSFQGALSIFISSLFYFVLFFENKKTYGLAIAQILVPIGFYFLYGWLKIPDSYLLYTVGFIGMIYLYSSLILRDKDLKDAVDISLFSGTLISIFVFLFAFSFDLSSWEKLIFSFLPIASGIAVSFIKREINFAYISSAFTIISSYIFVTLLLPYPHNQLFKIAFILTGIGVVFFVENMRFKSNKIVSDFLSVNTIIYLSISLFLCVGHPKIESLLFLITAVIFWIARLVWKVPKLTYGLTSCLYASCFFAMQAFHVSNQMYPLIFTALTIILYGYQLATKRHTEEFSNSALAAQSILALFYSTNIFFYSGFYREQNFLVVNSLITIYATMILFFVDSYLRKKPNVDYAASFAGLFTLIAQMKYSGIENLLYYTIPIGVYLLSLGYVRKKHEGDSSNIFDLMGNIVLILFPFVLSFDKSYYSLILGLISILLLNIGISLKNKIHTYGGSIGLILAVLPQTYSYILSLPKWVIVGILGLIFVGVAIFLLLKRKEEQ